MPGDRIWSGPNPYYLILVLKDQGVEKVDLDETGWIAKLGDKMRAEGVWHLVRKASDSVVFSMVVLEGEQPYYVARHVGTASAAGSNEVVCYGIGKKLPDGSVVRGWILPNGQITLGDNVELFARGMIGSG